MSEIIELYIGYVLIIEMLRTYIDKNILKLNVTQQYSLLMTMIDPLDDFWEDTPDDSFGYGLRKHSYKV